MITLSGGLSAVVPLLLVLGSVGTADGRRRLVCQYGSWSEELPGDLYYPVEDIPGELCTHVVYNYADLDTNSWTLRVPDVSRNTTGRFANLKKRFPKLKLALAVGGWGQGGAGLSQMAASRNHRKKFADSVVQVMQQYNLDGFVVAWLYPKIEDKDNFVYLLVELKRAMTKFSSASELIVEVPIADYPQLDETYDKEALCDAVDFVHVIGFDMRNAKHNRFTDVHSPIRRRDHDQGRFLTVNIQDGVQSWLDKSCPQEKIVLGVSFVARTYQLRDSANYGLAAPATGPGTRGPYTQEDGLLAYYELCEMLKSSSWSTYWDAKGLCPYAKLGNQWVGYESEQSLIEKWKWVNGKGLAGIYTYSLDWDDFRGKCGIAYPLLRTLHSYVEQQGNVDDDIDFAIIRS